MSVTRSDRGGQLDRDRGSATAAPNEFEPTGPVTDLAEMARTLRGLRTSVDDTLRALVESATVLVPKVDHACITVISGSRRVVKARTDDVAAYLCKVQNELGEGPTEDEIWTVDSVISGNLPADRRWPSFAAVARERGIASIAAFRLYADPATRDLGVLLMFSKAEDTFDSDAQIIGSALAAHGAVALLTARDVQNFRDGLASRDIIGQAKGMLMERYDVDAVQAFTMLAALSQSENRPLREIALSLIEQSHPTTSVDPSTER